MRISPSRSFSRTRASTRQQTPAASLALEIVPLPSSVPAQAARARRMRDQLAEVELHFLAGLGLADEPVVQPDLHGPVQLAAAPVRLQLVRA